MPGDTAGIRTSPGTISALVERGSSRIVNAYSRLALVYDAWSALVESRSLDAALNLAAIRNGEAVLEVAVGTGVLFRNILRRNPAGRNTGIDLTEAMLRRARRKAARTRVPFELRQADARALPFADASFDVLVNCNMLGMLPDGALGGILGEFRRVLRPGGRLVIVMMMRPRNRLAERVYRLLPVRLGCWRNVQIEPFVRSAGFAVVELEATKQLGIPSEILMALKPR
jgi:ubiquinone/menaquinone biosynthesis C-methylase UbiE